MDLQFCGHGDWLVRRNEQPVGAIRQLPDGSYLVTGTGVPPVPSWEAAVRTASQRL